MFDDCSNHLLPEGLTSVEVHPQTLSFLRSDPFIGVFQLAHFGIVDSEVQTESIPITNFSYLLVKLVEIFYFGASKIDKFFLNMMAITYY